MERVPAKVEDNPVQYQKMCSPKDVFIYVGHYGAHDAAEEVQQPGQFTRRYAKVQLPTLLYCGHCRPVNFLHGGSARITAAAEVGHQHDCGHTRLCNYRTRGYMDWLEGLVACLQAVEGLQGDRRLGAAAFLHLRTEHSVEQSRHLYSLIRGNVITVIAVFAAAFRRAEINLATRLPPLQHFTSACRYETYSIITR